MERYCCAPAKRCSAVPGGPWEETRFTTKMKLQNYHSARFKCTKMLIHPLQPSCDAQDAAICWQVDQKGHTSQQLSIIRGRLYSAALRRNGNVPPSSALGDWKGFLNGASTLKDYFVFPLNGSKYPLQYTLKVVHVLGILDPATPLVSAHSALSSIFARGGRPHVHCRTCRYISHRL